MPDQNPPLPVVTEQTKELLFESLFSEVETFDPMNFVEIFKSENPVLYEVVCNCIMALPEDSQHDAGESFLLLYMLLRTQALVNQGSSLC